MHKSSRRRRKVAKITPETNVASFLLAIGFCCMIYLLITSRSKMNSFPFNSAEIKQWRKQLNINDINDLHASVQSKTQETLEEREMILEKKLQFTGIAHKKGSSTRKFLTINADKILTSGLYVYFGKRHRRKRIHQIWVSKYEYPYSGEGGCLWLAFEMKDKSKWTMVVEENCRMAHSTLLRWLGGARKMPLRDPNDPDSEIGDHILHFFPANPAKWELKTPEGTFHLADVNLLRQQNDRYIYRGITLVGNDEKVLEYEIPKKFHRSLLLMKENTQYMRETNRIYPAREVIFKEGEQSVDVKDVRTQMSRGVEVVVVMKNSKIDEMFITNQRGNRIGYLDKDNFFPEMVTRN